MSRNYAKCFCIILALAFSGSGYAASEAQSFSVTNEDAINCQFAYSLIEGFEAESGSKDSVAVKEAVDMQAFWSGVSKELNSALVESPIAKVLAEVNSDDDKFWSVLGGQLDFCDSERRKIIQKRKLSR